MDQFRAAVEARDFDAVAATLADDVRFTSPVAYTPYEGKAMTTAIFRAVIRVVEGFEYVREIKDAGGRDSALVFRGTVGGKELTGCDFIHVGDDGLIDDFMVMVRPLSAAMALSEAMGAEFERIKAEAAAAS